jgi:hypothetical protein
MKGNVKEQLVARVRRAAVALVAMAAVAAGTVYASPPDSVVAVPPADLPALAQPTGDATLLQETIDGGVMLDIEQNQGARLVTFDVTGLQRVGAAKLMTAIGLTWVDPMTGALKVTHWAMDASLALDFGAIDPVLTYELNRMFDVKQVRAQMTRADTGTTFMLAEDGL